MILDDIGYVLLVTPEENSSFIFHRVIQHRISKHLTITSYKASQKPCMGFYGQNSKVIGVSDKSCLEALYEPCTMFYLNW